MHATIARVLLMKPKGVRSFWGKFGKNSLGLTKSIVSVRQGVCRLQVSLYLLACWILVQVVQVRELSKVSSFRVLGHAVLSYSAFKLQCK